LRGEWELFKIIETLVSVQDDDNRHKQPITASIRMPQQDKESRMASEQIRSRSMLARLDSII
jgi:hypothetical protein